MELQESKPVTKMKVEVWSDVMCPFCYIGKRQYEKALEKFDDKDSIEIVWKSFQLDPSIPEDISKGLPVAKYLSERKGISEAQVAVMHQQVTSMATNAGLEYHLDDTVVFNSFNAHRIIQLAKTKGLGDKAEEIFFKSYFTQAKDLGDAGVLRSIAAEIGLTDTEINEALTEDTYANAVTQDIQEAKRLGVNGVPFFVFNRKYAVSGAQPVDAFTQTLEKSFTEWRKDNPVSTFEVLNGQVCTPDGNCS